jgi:putative FmdB family regulatory protein
MPIYEYRCKRGHDFEVMQRMSDDALTSCQVCGSPVQRVFNPIAIHFKGSGFYNTDYGTRRRQREAKESGEGSSSATGKDSGAASGSGGSDSGSGGGDSGSGGGAAGGGGAETGSGKSTSSAGAGSAQAG